MPVSLYKYLGFMFVALAGIGVVLPLVPTTPFLLLAAGCFARSSKRWHDWLMAQPLFSGLIHNWQEYQCVTLGTKITAIVTMTIFGGYSIIFAIENPVLQIAGLILILIGFYYVGRIPVCNRHQR